MLQLPKIKSDLKESEDLCRCRPICKNRRRGWKGQLQNTSGELKLERKPLQECFRRWPKKVYPNSPCPLLGRTRGVVINEKYAILPRNVVRICQAPIDDKVDTTYLKFAEMAMKLGAYDAVRAKCAFCDCHCCGCTPAEYSFEGPARDAIRRRNMSDFDARVKKDYQPMRIMYDKN